MDVADRDRSLARQLSLDLQVRLLAVAVLNVRVYPRDVRLYGKRGGNRSQHVRKAALPPESAKLARRYSSHRAGIRWMCAQRDAIKVDAVACANNCLVVCGA